jgi:hypothetical protein
MNKKPLKRLESVPLRLYWQREDTDFTPWLAEEENLAYLGEMVGMKLELEDTEANVGPYRADILCRDMATDAYVLIENQLEQTDHTHLGQLMTYSAGLRPATIIWIAQKFTDQHRAAIDWLNGISFEDYRFFGIEIELYRIGQSDMAPRFNLVAKPNDWTKTVHTQNRQASGNSERADMYRQLWDTLLGHLKSHHNELVLPKASGRHWIRFPMGYTNIIMSYAPNSHQISLYQLFRAPDRAKWYTFICADPETFNEESGIPFVYKDDGSYGYGLYQFAFDHEKIETHKEHFAHLGKQLVQLQKAISKRQAVFEEHEEIVEEND